MRNNLWLLLLISMSCAWAGDAKDYPITLKVLETDAVVTKADGTRTTTNCTVAPGGDQINCDSTQFPGSTHTDLTSLAQGSDGKTYVIQCMLGGGRSILAAMGQAGQAYGGVPTVSGCNVPPGNYKARWHKGQLLIAHEKNGKIKETAFAVLTSRLTVTTTDTQQAIGSEREKTVLKLSSTPTGGDISLDGVFVGQTPSSIPVSSGEHSVSITKSGFKRWERKITTQGGETSLAADLDPAS